MRTLTKFAVATLIIISSISTAAASPADLTIFPKESSTKINSFTSYEVQIENTGPVKDVYTFSSKTNEVSIAPRQVELQPGQKETVNVWYNPQVTKEAGTYRFTVTATSRANGKRFSTEGIVNVIKDHQVSVSVTPDQRTACLNEKVTYTVEVTNNGIQKEEFALETKLGKLAKKRVTLEDGETKSVKLTVSANTAMEKSFNVVAASTTSYAQDIETVNFKSEVCYASDVSLTPQNKEIAAFTDAEYKVTVRNTGTKSDQFVLSTSQGRLGDTKMQIGSKSSKSTTLTVTPETLGEQTVTVTAKSTVTSRGTATLNVYNGMDVSATPAKKTSSVCENRQKTLEYTVKNTGEAKDTYKLTQSLGSLNRKKNELTLKPGETETVEVTVDAKKLQESTNYPVRLQVASTTFKQPVKTATTTLRVENCWDLKMNVVPEIASAGENRSVIYEIHLENPGTRQNTYEMAYKGPAWVEIKPSEMTVESGGRKTAYMYAGVPFEKQGQVKINVTGVGNEVKRHQEVELVIGKDIRKSIFSDKNQLTGAFGNIVQSLGEATTSIKVIGSLLIGILLTAAILFWER